MKRTKLVVSIVMAVWALAGGTALGGSGMYLSSELGANFAPGLDLKGDANDGNSACDEFINPQAPLLPQCVDQGRTLWESDVDGAEGILAGAAIGYRLRDTYPDRFWGRFRLELEYFFREAEYDEAAPVSAAGGATLAKLGGEIEKAEDRVGNISSHNLFGNLYFDGINESRFTPYVGFGVGVGFTDMDHGILWARNPDSNAITTGTGLANADEIRRNLAGTTSSHQTELSDTLFGYQVLFGVDYALTESISLGVKGRWVHFDNFEDASGSLDRLRSHESNRRSDGSQPVMYSLKTDDIEMFGVSVNLKYHF